MTEASAATQDVRSPVETLPANLDHERFLADYREGMRITAHSMLSVSHTLKAAIKPACAHDAYSLLWEQTGQMDDHDTAHVQCRACGNLYVVTFWKTDRETDFTPMPQPLVQMYELQWLQEEAEDERRRIEDGPSDDELFGWNDQPSAAERREMDARDYGRLKR